MIDEQKTFDSYGYTSNELKPQSGKPIVAVCDGCGYMRVIRKADYRDLCHTCKMSTVKTRGLMSKSANIRCNTIEGKKNLSKAMKNKKHSEQTKHKMSNARLGDKNHFYGKQHNDLSKQKQSIAKKGKQRTDLSKQKQSIRMTGLRVGNKHPMFGKKVTEEHKRKTSATLQGIPLSEWEGYLTDNPYCEKFNAACRERNRDKYGRKCFICGKPESENFTKTGKLRKLSVHHVDRNKDQGCNDHNWCLIPLCLKRHGCAHHEPWVSRINYLLSM